MSSKNESQGFTENDVMLSIWNNIGKKRIAPRAVGGRLETSQGAKFGGTSILESRAEGGNKVKSVETSPGFWIKP